MVVVDGAVSAPVLAAAAAAAAPAAPSAPTVVVDEHAIDEDVEAKPVEAKLMEAKPVEAMAQAKPESPGAEGKRMTIEDEEALASKITNP